MNSDDGLNNSGNGGGKDDLADREFLPEPRGLRELELPADTDVLDDMEEDSKA